MQEGSHFSEMTRLTGDLGLGKVEDEAMFVADSSQVGSDHGEVHIADMLDGLEFDDDLVTDQQVKPMQANLDLPIEHRNDPGAGRAVLGDVAQAPGRSRRPTQ